MCYCANAEQLLGAAITAAENKIPQLEAGIKEAVAEKKQLEADLVAHKADRIAAKATIEKATALRSEEAAAFAKEKSDADTNIAAGKRPSQQLRRAWVVFSRPMQHLSSDLCM